MASCSVKVFLTVQEYSSVLFTLMTTRSPLDNIKCSLSAILKNPVKISVEIKTITKIRVLIGPLQIYAGNKSKQKFLAPKNLPPQKKLSRLVMSGSTESIWSLRKGIILSAVIDKIFCHAKISSSRSI